MNIRYALIVDDSKTAQLRLKRMLEAYTLEIDTVSSAEEALAYLSYRTPEVIFLDQSMKGMDGIEALKTIKANPTTATIPVIMYTSEKGEVFTGQARALGALDILYKSTLKPDSLEKVLRTLKLDKRDKRLDANQASTSDSDSPTPLNSTTDQADTSSPATMADLEEIRGQIARLFEIHIADVGRQIAKSTQFITKRVSAQKDQTNKQPTEIVIGDVPLNVINEEVSRERQRVSLIANTLLSALLVGLALLGVILVNLYHRLDSMSNQYQTTSDITELNTAHINQLSQQLFEQQSAPLQSRSLLQNQQLLDTLSWAMTANLQFDLNQPPLHESLLTTFQHLLYQLHSLDYQGLIELSINFGNVCLAPNDSGELTLAPSDTPISQCQFRQDLNEDFIASDFLTVQYLQLEQLAQPIREGSILMSVVANGFNQPRVDYPPADSLITAGAWNNVALQNNYVRLNFYSLD
ncbi:response regulator [Aurantivibrio plasticivorans]